MRRPIIMGGNPFIADVYRKDAKTLFDETGGNSGNLAFRYAVASHFPGNVPVLGWHNSGDQVRSAGDIIVLPLANQLGSHTDLADQAVRLEEFGLPVVGVGLGAQAINQSQNITLTPGTTKWLETIRRLSPSENPNIGVRGPFTQSQIERIGFSGAATVTGCPSNFINGSDIAKQLKDGFGKTPRRIAVMAGIPFIPSLSRIERDLADIVTATGGAYIVQHELGMLQLARREFELMAPERLELCRSYIAPQLTRDEFETWCCRYAHAFYDARAWMDYIRRFDFVVGTRFHGAMLAIQAGVPAGCITHDSRTQEMCETMNIPHCRHTDIAGGLTQHNLMEYFAFDADLYKASRIELAGRYAAIYRNAEVAISRNLAAISGA